MTDRLIISKKQKGDDGYRVFSIRIKVATATALDNISLVTGYSRNELINLLLEYGIQHYEIEE